MCNRARGISYCDFRFQSPRFSWLPHTGDCISLCIFWVPAGDSSDLIFGGVGQLTASMQAKGSCDRAVLCWMWLLVFWKEHAREAILTVFTLCLHSESKFIANRDLNYFCVIYSLYEMSKGFKQILYIIDIYQKENPRLLNLTLLPDFLACCLNIYVKHWISLFFSHEKVTAKQESGCEWDHCNTFALPGTQDCFFPVLLIYKSSKAFYLFRKDKSMPSCPIWSPQAYSPHFVKERKLKKEKWTAWIKLRRILGAD